jgi:tRNA pseudouridine38-40 synthase
VVRVTRIRLDLSHDGTSFAGWARQPGLRTVQGTIEDALEVVLRTQRAGLASPRLTVAGRTDAGVHARGQVAHVDVDPALWEAVRGRSDRGPEEALVSRLAGLLSPDVVVHRATPAPVGFDARFSAVRRRYVYRVSDDPRTRDPLRRSHVLWQRRALDVDAMRAGAQALLGRHDFAAFCKPREGATTIRTLEMFDWERPSSGPDAALVVAHIQADAFCHSMVRALVGASLAVGEGRRSVDWLADLLVGRLRDPAGAVVPAHGLTLEEVTYPPDEQLASRAEQTRALRSHDEVDATPRTVAASRPAPSGAAAPGAPG